VLNEPAAGRLGVDLSQHDLAGWESPAAELTVWLHPGPPLYPHRLPTLALSAPGIPAWGLKAATGLLARKASGLLGSPMLYELACTVPECLRDALAAGPEPAACAVEDAPEVVESSRSCALDVVKPAPSQKRQNRRRPPSARPLADVERESIRLREDLAAWMSTGSGYEAMRRAREALPAWSCRGSVLEAVESSRAVVISGATGCGKSTQVPQFVLEQWVSEGRGGACQIVCTQPRRISAVGLASRVAAERGEHVGGTVGFSVRLESKQSQKTHLLFCTTGILLRRLMGDSSLAGVSHVIVDEVHERSLESDLLLLLLRGLAQRRTDLRVILMSATADAEMFARYFHEGGVSAGTVSIPGFTFPVRELFLEDILERTGFMVSKTSRWARKGNAGAKGGKGKALDDSCSGEAGALSEQTRRSLENIDEACVNFDLVCAAVAYMIAAEARDGPGALLAGWEQEPETEGAKGGGSGRKGPGAVLVFLPGALEIFRMQRALGDSKEVAAACSSARCQLVVLPLHGALPTTQQARVFERPPRGARKVVLATNVAETSITIDDVTCVIDCGRVKETSFDSAVGMSRLVETWVSRAAAQQRRGRAGRVQSGVCFRTFSRATWRSMAAYQPPEISRVPLQGLCMQVRSILGGSSGRLQDLLSQAITPPEPAALQQAIAVLQSIQALDSQENLTPLGEHLTQLPLDAHIGKMLVHAAVLRCLDPCLTIAAALGHGRPIWLAPPDRREEAAAAKQIIAKAAGPAAKSDHLLVVAAYNMWEKARECGGRGAAHGFAAEHFLSDQAMEAIEAGRRDLAGSLADIGLVPKSYLSAMRGKGNRNDAWRHANASADNANIVKAALCAGFYPNVLRVEHPVQRYKAVEAGAVEADSGPQEVRYFERGRGRVFLHPSSINFSCGRFESSWLVFTEMVETSKAFVRDSSMVPAYAMLLFGGAMTVHHEEGLVRLDGWACFRVPARVAVLLQRLRSEFERLLAAKMEDVGLDMGSAPVSEAMLQLLATDGF